MKQTHTSNRVQRQVHDQQTENMISKPAEFYECQISNSNDVASKEVNSRELVNNKLGESETRENFINKEIKLYWPELLLDHR